MKPSSMMAKRETGYLPGATGSDLREALGMMLKVFTSGTAELDHVETATVAFAREALLKAEGRS